jgi:hypothetical protein
MPSVMGKLFSKCAESFLCLLSLSKSLSDIYLGMVVGMFSTLNPFRFNGNLVNTSKWQRLGNKFLSDGVQVVLYRQEKTQRLRLQYLYYKMYRCIKKKPKKHADET